MILSTVLALFVSGGFAAERCNFDDDVKSCKEWAVSVSDTNFTSDYDRSSLIGATISLDGFYKLSNQFSVKASPVIYWKTGRSQSWYGQDAFADGFNFKQLIISYNPNTKYLTLDAGAVNLGYLGSSLLVSSDRSFPGFRESLTLKREYFDLSVSALQSMPPSNSTNDTRTTKERDPVFLSQTADLTLKYKKAYYRTSVTHYSYGNLPSSVAFDSAIKGNTVINSDGSQANAVFAYTFDGILFGSELGFDGDWGGSVNYTVINNNKAPKRRNLGSMLNFSGKIPFFHDQILSSLQFFRNESDTSPAYYNGGDIGHNNRKGYTIEMSYLFKRSDVKISTGYTDADLIDPATGSAQVSRDKTVYLSFSTLFQRF